MSATDFLKDFVIDAWYKAIVYVGGVVLALSFFLDVKGLTNHQLQLLASGAFIIGLGEWNNHTTQSWIKPPNAYTGPAALLTQKIRKATVIGVLFDLIGITVFTFGMIRILRP